MSRSSSSRFTGGSLRMVDTIFAASHLTPECHPYSSFCPQSELTSLDLFDQLLPTLCVLAHQQQGTERRQVVRQFAIGTGIHIVDECGNRASEIASVEGAVQKLTSVLF